MNLMTTTTAQLLPASRILVMRYRFIGDTILTVPFLRNLRRAYPHATIDALVGPESGLVLAGCPYVDELIPFDTTRFHKYDRGQGKPRNFLSYATILRKRSYDLIFILKRSWSSGLLSWLSGARWRVGYDTEGRRIFLTHPVIWDKNKHEVESTLDVLRGAGVPVEDNFLEAWVTSDEMRQVKAMVPELTRTETKVLIHAAAAHPDKMYSLDKWAQIVQQLHQQFGIIPFYTGAQQDRPLYDKLAQLSAVPAVNLAGQLSLRQSMSLYKEMDMAVCVDSGPAHLAAAVDTPTVAIFGPTDPHRWRPWGAEHVAIFDPGGLNKCAEHEDCNARCLGRLSPEHVISECVSILSKRQSPAGSGNKCSK